MTVKRWFIGLLVLLSLVSALSAQDAAQPLILVKAGDLWEWTGGSTLRQKTQWGYNDSQLFLSPLNNEVAYNSLPQFIIDWIESQPGRSDGTGSLPSNLWVIATSSTDQAYRIAEQPADTSLMPPAGAPDGLVRAQPIWSPDGMQIAWVEQDFGSTTSRLMVYDKTSRTVRTLASDLPQQTGLGFYFEGVWTDKGLVMFSRTNSETSPTGMSLTYIVFDPVTGEKKFDIAAENITLKDETLDARIALPVQYQGKTWLAVAYFGENIQPVWKLIDLDAGQFTGEAANIVGYASGHAETSLRVIPVFPPGKIGYYVVQQADGTVVRLSPDPEMVTSKFAVSPDGKAVAYHLHNIDVFESNTTLYIWRDGAITTVPQTEHPAIISDFAWGSITWEVGGEGPGVGAPGS